MVGRGFFLTLHAVRCQLAAMPNESYFIRLIHGSTRKLCPGERIWDAGQLQRGSVVRFLRARNLQGYDVYLWPYAEDRNSGYILLDLDHASPDILARMRAHGHEPCVLLQSSPGHLQAWIRVSTTPLEPAVATAISKQLAHTYGGDLASTDWRHLGRLAGFTNQKPQRRTPTGQPPWVKIVAARAVVASAAPDLLHGAITQPSITAMCNTTQRAQLIPSARATITAEGAARIYQRWMERWHIRERFPQPDWSVVDLWLARALLSMHVSPTQVEAILRLGSPHFPRHHGDPEDYLRRTLVCAAFPPPAPHTVCSTHATAPLRPHHTTDSNGSGPRSRR